MKITPGAPKNESGLTQLMGKFIRQIWVNMFSLDVNLTYLYHHVLLQLCEKFEAAVAKINTLETENKKLREESQKYDETQKNVQKNISSLLITARTEINRKEKEIKNLR